MVNPRLPEPIRNLCEIVLDGRCPIEHLSSGRCPGRLKVFVYRWCDQHRIACDTCGAVVKVHGLNMEPMPKHLALKLRDHIEFVNMSPDFRLSDLTAQWRRSRCGQFRSESLF